MKGKQPDTSQERYGYRVERAKECGFKLQYCRNCAWSVNKVSLRKDTLTFFHHAQVAALPAPAQEQWPAASMAVQP